MKLKIAFRFSALPVNSITLCACTAWPKLNVGNWWGATGCRRMLDAAARLGVGTVQADEAAADQARMAQSAMAKTAAREQTKVKSVEPEWSAVSKPLKTLAEK
jgi:hypothetical protein